MTTGLTVTDKDMGIPTDDPNDPPECIEIFDRIRPGGRLVANTGTLDSESLLLTMFRRYGGSLTRLEVSHADAVGGFTSWNPARPVTQWSVIRPEELPA